MIALVDCVSFYANVERQFHAALQNRPIIVLSNNDGNIVSLSPEARTLGFKRGMAYHQCQRLIQEHHVAVFSSNFALYQDVSDRIMALLADFALVRDGIIQQERYSIDECFLDLSHVADEHLLAVGRRMQATVVQATGIKVRVKENKVALLRRYSGQCLCPFFAGKISDKVSLLPDKNSSPRSLQDNKVTLLSGNTSIRYINARLTASLML